MDALPDSPPEEIQKVVFKVLRCVSVFITFYPFPSREITRFFFGHVTMWNVGTRDLPIDLELLLASRDV